MRNRWEECGPSVAYQYHLDIAPTEICGAYLCASSTCASQVAGDFSMDDKLQAGLHIATELSAADMLKRSRLQSLWTGPGISSGLYLETVSSS